ncbi:MAG: MFS transporter [Hyphomicrobiales bacterium]|nr:MAG: MFS transporter [Hyphomicrobiales bacterium]
MNDNFDGGTATHNLRGNSSAEVSNSGQPDETLGPERRKKIFAGSLGNMVELLDWCIYATFSSVFAHQFFPSGSQTSALLATLAIFAVSFVMRPVGAAVIGVYADKFGRKNSLVLTVGLMSVTTLIIGVAPTYAQIGAFAPLLLLTARLIQGFAAGGEFGSASAYLVESATPTRRGLAGSWQQVSVAAGLLLASGMGAVLTTALPKDSLESWGWRVGFIASSVLGLVALWLRRSVEENKSFETGKARTKNKKKSSLVVMLRDHPRAFFRVFALNIPGIILYNVFITFLPTYAHIAKGLPLGSALTANAIAIAVFMVCLPLVGSLSDRIGRRPTMLMFATGMVAFSWPALHLLNDNFWVYLGIQVTAVILLVGYSANLATIMAEQFPPEVRVTGIGLPYSLCLALFGGTVPYLMTRMYSNGLSDWLWVYCTAAAIFGVFIYARMPETRGIKMD